MADINNVVLVGRITRDAELRYTPSSVAVCKISLAINNRRKIGDKWEDEAHFFDVTIFGKTAESLHRFLTKGKQIGVEGQLRQNRWEQDGQSRSKVEVVATNVQLLGSAGGGTNVSTGSGKSYSESAGQPMDDFPGASSNSTEFEDDIPF